MSLWNQKFVKNTTNNSENNYAHTDQAVSNQHLKRRISDLVQDYSWSPEYFPNLQQRTGLTGVNTIPTQMSQPFYSNSKAKQEPTTYDFLNMPRAGAIPNTAKSENEVASHLNTSTLSSQPSTTTDLENKLQVKRITSGNHQKNIPSHSSGNYVPSRRPAFVLKLWNMVNDEKNQEYIRWADDGQSFIIQNKENFDQLVLPRYFKHSNYSSFVRQLNLYGWHKVQDVNSGAMQSGEEIRQFKSPYFIRGREDLLDKIVRNKGAKGHSDKENGGHSDLNKILDELDMIKSNQMEIAADLYRIRNDNQMLWRECYESRERHKTHTDMFERILRLLASAFSSSQGTGGKFVNDSSATNNLISSILGATGGSSVANSTSVNTDTSGPTSAKTRLLLGNGTMGTQISEVPSDGANLLSPYNNSDKSRISAVDEHPGAHLSELSTPTDADTPASVEATASNNSVNSALFNPVATTGFSMDPLQATVGPESLNELFFPDPTIISPTDQSSLPAADSNSESYKVTSPLVQHSSLEVTEPSSLSKSAILVDPISVVTPELVPSSQQSPSNAIGPNSESLAANDKNLEDLMRSIDFQGDSLQRIQDRLSKYFPQDYTAGYDDSSTNTDFISVVPSVEAKPTHIKQEPGFDVDDFLLNTNSEDVGESDDEEPVRKKARK